jgi:hypothetical protein
LDIFEHKVPYPDDIAGKKLELNCSFLPLLFHALFRML